MFYPIVLPPMRIQDTKKRKKDNLGEKEMIQEKKSPKNSMNHNVEGD